MDCPPVNPTLECLYERDGNFIYVYGETERETYEVTTSYFYEKDFLYLRVSGDILFESNRSEVVRYTYRHSYRLPKYWTCSGVLPPGVCYEDGRLTAEYQSETVEGFAWTMIAIDWEVAMRPVSDINEDGVVDSEDLGILLSGWGVSGPADINGDGVTNGADLGILQMQWGEGS